ncbi:MAG TPA: YraN family protein [Steroidobacteraceae bacterium]|nr:YraN family protein [Steroidobacteraceae bacterium]
MLTSRQQRGQRAEQLAAEFLRAAGCEILHCNFRRRLGELDIVARSGHVLVVAEVRTRASTAYGGAAASVTHGKQRRITRAAAQLLQQRADLARLPVRFDVVVVTDPLGVAPAVEWIQHAFEAC